MSSLQRSAGSPQSLCGPPQVPQNYVYGSGLVFGGNVYPVLVNGYPMQPPMVAHQVAGQQRIQMQQRPRSPQIPGNTPIVLPQQRPCQLSGARVGTRCPAPQNTAKPNQASFVKFPAPVVSQQMRMQQQQQQQLQLQAQIFQRQQMLAAMGNSYSDCGNYNLQQNAGESEGWSGYAMMSPMDATKPYSFGWGLTN
ncbi:uncharacterized protein LOC108089030 [Drosophila ficusphila]|uniref:uncharacterized protein LOC108089030 n=1 Tax=Drosophila ficusphila TaxID=30025 RepID=UPI0007E787CA|nr:uncharacterized protein LOC108089030 [Drosophila ficusphila]